MTEKAAQAHEHPSSGILAATYYAGGEIERVPHESVPAASALTGFRILDAQKVRPEGSATEAYEITLQVLGNKQAVLELQPGVVFALEPKNHAETVDAVLCGLLHEGMDQNEGEALTADCLKKVAKQTVELPVKTSYLEGNSIQRLSKREALSGTVDLSRPTTQLVGLLLQRKGFPASLRTVERIAASYSVEQLLDKYPGLISLEELCANQPPLNSRPYTISDYDREAGTVKIVVSDVEAEIPPATGDTDPEHKQHGIATRMLLDIAKNPDAWDYILNGSLAVHGPKVFFPCMSGETASMESYRNQTENTYWQEKWNHFSPQAEAGDKTLFLLGTGSGIAPYLALLREYKRQCKGYPGKIVLINGGRGPEGDMFQKEIQQFLDDGILDAYHYADSTVNLSDGEKARIQNVLRAEYGGVLCGLLAAKKAMVYVCGAEDAKNGVDAVLAKIAGFDPESKEAVAFIAKLEDKCLIQSTASKPNRFFTHWYDQQSDIPSYWLPKERESWKAEAAGGKSASNQGAWANRVWPVVPQGREAMGRA